MDPTWLFPVQLDLWSLSFQSHWLLCLRIKLYRLFWVLWILADCIKTWAPVPVGSATVADAFFVELLNKLLDRKSCSEIAQPLALSSGKVSKITIFNN